MWESSVGICIPECPMAKKRRVLEIATTINSHPEVEGLTTGSRKLFGLLYTDPEAERLMNEQEREYVNFAARRALR